MPLAAHAAGLDCDEAARLRAERDSARGQVDICHSIIADQARALATVMVQAPASTLTWTELWNSYADVEIEKLEAPKTQMSMGRQVVRILGAAKVADMTITSVREYRRARRATLTIRGKPPSQKTVNNEVILIRRLTKWATRQRPALLSADPLASACEQDMLVPVQNVRYNIVEDDPGAPVSLDQFLRRADPLEAALVLVGHSSGMRRREIALLELSWIDRRQRLITIPPGIAKGRRGRKKGRVTIISDDALNAIDAYRERLKPAARSCRWVFVNERKLTGLHPDFFSRRFKKLQQRVGAIGPSGPVWLHDATRRSFVTLARRRGEDAVRVMKLAGHSTLESQERYHVESLEETIRSRDRIEAARAADAAAVRAFRRGPKRAPNHPCRINNSKS